jgi:hypothetical protein
MEQQREMEQKTIHAALSERALEYLVPKDAQFVKCPSCLKQIPSTYVKHHQNGTCRGKPDTDLLKVVDDARKMLQREVDLALLKDDALWSLEKKLRDPTSELSMQMVDQEREKILKLTGYLQDMIGVKDFVDTDDLSTILPMDVWAMLEAAEQATTDYAKGAANLEAMNTLIQDAKKKFPQLLTARLNDRMDAMKAVLDAGAGAVDRREMMWLLEQRKALNIPPEDFPLSSVKQIENNFLQEDLRKAKTEAQITAVLQECYRVGYKDKLVEDKQDRLRELRKIPPGWDVKAVLDAGGKVARVDTSGPEWIDAFQDLFNHTFKPVKTGDRGKQDGDRRMPTSLIVKKVTKVLNEQVWNEYIPRREQVLWQNGKVDGTRRTGGITWPNGMRRTITEQWFNDSPKVKALQGLDPNFRKDVNETFMFHGTHKAAAQGITESDFLLSMAGAATGTMLGRGIYLAEACSKSDEYTRDEDGLRILLLCRTSLGRLLYNEEKRPDAAMIENLCGVGKAKGSGDYDAVVGDREKLHNTYREFCIFDDDLVYPEYIIHYVRQH